MALAIGQNLAADGIITVTRYVWARAALAVRLRRHPGPESLVPVRITVAHLALDGRGGLDIDGLEVTGSVEGVTSALATILTSAAPVASAVIAGAATESTDDGAETTGP